MNAVDILFFFKDEIGKFFFPVDQDQAIVEICGTVIRFNNTYARKTTVDVLIGNAIFPAEVPVIEAEFAETYTPNGLCTVVIIDMRLVTDIFLVHVPETQFAKAKHYFTFAFLKRSQRYHFFGRLMAISVPNIPAIVPVINPAITSVG